MEVVEFNSSSSSDEETPNKRTETTFKSDSIAEGNPMVSGKIIPITVWVEIMVASSGRKGFLTALLD